MSAARPLLCNHCGVIDAPRLSPGTGPHVAKASCAACHGFIKWLPKLIMKETKVIACVNRVVLLGTIGKYGVTLKYATNGTPCASFTLVVTEQGQDGKEHATFIECEVWGKKAERASDLASGDWVLFEGRLRKRQKGESQWEIVVSGFEVTPLRASAEVVT